MPKDMRVPHKLGVGGLRLSLIVTELGVPTVCGVAWGLALLKGESLSPNSFLGPASAEGPLKVSQDYIPD